MGAESVAAVEVGWSPARAELVRLHHALGLSAALSARLIGGVSRNAVISKRRRMGLTGANPLQAANRVFRTCHPASGPGPLVSAVSLALPRSYIDPLEPPCEPLPFMDSPPPPDADPKILAERSRGECAWPLGPAEVEGDHRTLFCCAPVRRGRSYCGAHAAAALSQEPPPPLRLRRSDLGLPPSRPGARLGKGS